MSDEDTSTDTDDVDETADQDSPEEADSGTTDDAKVGKGGKDDDSEPFDADRAKAKIHKANNEAKKLRDRLKELEPLAAKAKELEDADKTETERLTERASAAEKRALEAEVRVLRMEVAAEKGLTPAQAKRLVGSSKEELEEDADDLLTTFPVAEKTKARVPGRPREVGRGGGDPDEPPEEKDPSKLAAAIPRRR